MRFKTLISITLLSTFFFTNAQNDGGDKDGIRLIQVKDDIYMIEGKGGNIGLSFGSDGVFMIDNKFADMSEDILKEIKKKDKNLVQFLINTHHHGDHTGGNINMKEAGATIVAHENVRKRLSESFKNATSKSEGDPRKLPTITFTEDMTFHYNGEEIMVFHVHDAHTDGDAIVYFTGSNVIHTGDVLFKDRYPYIDLDNGGSVMGYIRALEKIGMLADDKTVIIPGHGNVASKNDLEATANMLSMLYKRVSYHYVNKKSEAEIIAMRDFTKQYDDKGFGKGFISTERMLQTLYNDVKKTRGEIDKRTLEEQLQDKVRQQKEEAEKGKNE
jgi:glyoxylase-like metal-dependent hydrolase (beta-lactamase superfamily II)